jgi:uncharacterized protein
MKASYYNFFFPYEGDPDKLIAYNSRSNALALIKREKYDMFTDFCENGQEIQDKELIESLKSGLFLIDDDVNERDLIRFNMFLNRYSNTGLSFTIAPTSDCNFRCIYCYEKDVIKPTYMDEGTQDKIVDLLKGKVKTISNFHVTWYGGEPLLGFDTIVKLSKKFIEICDENDVAYSADMITNGYLLNRDKIKIMNELKINFMQITIDGLPETHNKRRPLANGNETYNEIIYNLKNNIDILPYISLRINVDKSNLSAGKLICEIIKENQMGHKVHPYLGKTSNDNDCYDSPDCLNMCEFSKADYNLSIENSEDILSKYPSIKTSFCGADNMSAYVIGADGELYRCWSDMGVKERSFGNINDSFGIANRALLDYMLFDPTLLENCSKCKLLPVCMGGCPFRRLSKIEDKCSIYKYMLENYLRKISQKLKNSSTDKCCEEACCK